MSQNVFSDENLSLKFSCEQKLNTIRKQYRIIHMTLPSNKETLKILGLCFSRLMQQAGFPNRALLQEFIGTLGTEFRSDLFERLKPTLTTKLWEQAEKDYEASLSKEVKVMSIFEEEFPARLRTISGPPICLSVRGSWDVLLFERTFIVSLVGSRHCTSFGESFAKQLAYRITQAQGVVVSGLARGIDTAAHKGAISASYEATNETSAKHPGFGIMGSGVLNIYPSENQNLVSELLERGGTLVSEYGLYSPPLKHHFPERNRIISALSDAVIVIEAKEKSGALITARTAAEQGREVFAVPGALNNPSAAGTLALLKQGAHCFTKMEDLLAALPHAKRHGFSMLGQAVPSETGQQTAHKVRTTNRADSRGENAPAELSKLSQPAQQLWTESLSEVPKDLDELLSSSKLAPGILSELIIELDLAGLITCDGSGFYSKKQIVDML